MIPNIRTSRRLISPALRTRRAILRVVAALAWLCVSIAIAAAQNEPVRPFQIDDMFDLEAIGRYYGGPYSFSPDGRALAFTKVRPRKTLANHKWEYLWGNAGGDVWLQAAPGEAPVNLTNGISDSSGWWSPQWSPDGERIAMLSTRGGNVTLWVWEKATGELRRLTTRGLDRFSVRPRPFIWADPRRILFPALPEGEKPFGMTVELRTQEIATAAWPKTVEGKEPTASVLQSGVTPDLSKRPQGDLLLIDVVEGTGRPVVSGSTSHWRLSPDGRTVAFARQVSLFMPKASETLPFGAAGTYTAELRRIDGRRIEPDQPLPRDVLPDSLRWSPDGRELAFLSYAGTRDEPPRLYRLKAGSGRITEIDLGELDAAPLIFRLPQLEWTSDGELLLLAARLEEGRRPDADARRDWWLVARNGRQRNLTSGMGTPPPELWPQVGRAAFVGLAEGEIWRMRPDNGTVENLTGKVEPPIAQVAWPILTNSGDDEYPHPGRTYSQIIFSIREERYQEFSLLELKSGAIAALEKPAEAAGLKAFAPATDSAVYSASDRQGTFIWRSSVATGQTDELMAANIFLRDIAEGDFRSIEYTSLNGEELKAWIILPAGYEKGKRCPMITWVYPGSVVGPIPSPYDSVSHASALNRQIPPASGYAVLIPSMPLNPLGEPEDPMMKLPDGVLPAVDAAVELGIADPERIFLMGQSFGGFATYGLVTQTNRFKAAVALAGLSNLISLYGQFDARMRYTDYAHEHLFQAGMTEALGMGNPPWKDLGRYLRNSPIFFVDRVQTPLMIIQGDMDYVAMQQGEEFFMSLYRQGKRAQFVRYWGEGHVLQSPANIRDMWRRIFAWFEEFSPQSSSMEQRGVR